MVVYKNCAELPAAADRFAYHKVEFRAVEWSFSDFGQRVDAFFGASFDNCLFGFVPVFVGAEIFFFVFGVAERYLTS